MLDEAAVKNSFARCKAVDEQHRELLAKHEVRITTIEDVLKEMLKPRPAPQVKKKKRINYSKMVKQHDKEIRELWKAIEQMRKRK